MRGTRVSEVIDAVLVGVKAQPEIEEVAVVDGARVVNDYRDYIIFIGYRPSADEFISVSRVAPRGLQANDTERLSIGFLVAAKDAGDDMKIARDRAAEKLHAIERLVTENMTLGLTGVKAAMGDSMGWLTLHTDKGAECNISGDITVDVLL